MNSFLRGGCFCARALFPTISWYPSPPCSSPSLLPDILIIIIINYRREGEGGKGLQRFHTGHSQEIVLLGRVSWIRLLPSSVTICQLIDVEFIDFSFALFIIFQFRRIIWIGKFRVFIKRSCYARELRLILFSYRENDY